MANRPLKGINFPGLEDTYIIPQPDQTYDATSENAQSGKAVAEAITEHTTDTEAHKELFEAVVADAAEYTDTVAEELTADIADARTYTNTQVNSVKEKIIIIPITYANKSQYNNGKSYPLYRANVTLNTLKSYTATKLVFGRFMSGTQVEYFPLIMNNKGCNFGYRFYPITISGTEYWYSAYDITGKVSQLENIVNNEIPNLIHTLDEAVDSNAADITTLTETVESNTTDINTLAGMVKGMGGYTKVLDKVEITADDITVAGDDGITLLSAGSDDLNLAPYNEILIHIEIPASDTINTADAMLCIIATPTSEYYWSDTNRLLHVQSTSITNAGGIQAARANEFMISANFYNDTFLYGELRKHGYGKSYGYAGAMNAWTSVSPYLKLSEKRYFHIATTKGGFKFPAGTFVEIYAR